MSAGRGGEDAAGDHGWGGEAGSGLVEGDYERRPPRWDGCEEVSLEAEGSGLSDPRKENTDKDASAAVAAVPTSAVSAFNSAFTNAKAGMSGVNFEEVKRVVHAMSKDSAHYNHQTKQELAVETRIRAMQKRWVEVRSSSSELSFLRDAVEKRMVILEAKRNLSKTWIHVDMDAFFAAVHMLEQPELKDVPMAVGGMSMISTANYVARRFGVRSAMPGFIAKKLCPHLVFVKPDFEKYRHYAALTREVFRSFDADFDAGSLDEAYLEISAYMNRTGTSSPDAVAAALRVAVREKTGGLTCSAGVAPTRRLAKVCSDVNKPDGQKVIAADRREVMELLAELPVRKVGGIGKVQERVLAAFDITTVGGLLRERVLIAALFTPAAAQFLLEISLGVGSEHRPEGAPEGAPQRKSLSQERTFSPTSDRRVIEATVMSLAAKVAAGLVEEGLRARTVTIKLKRATFEVVQRQTVLPSFTNDVTRLTSTALRLLMGEFPTGPLRLVGIKASQFEGGDGGLDDAAQTGAGQLHIDKLLTTATAEGSHISAFTAQEAKQSPRAQTAGSGSAAGVAEGIAVATYLCLECGRVVPKATRTEHDDWHFARSLQREDTLLAPSAAAAAGGTSGKRGGNRGRGGGARHKSSSAQATLHSLLGATKQGFK